MCKHAQNAGVPWAVYISLGSNSGEGREILEKALAGLASMPGIRVLLASPVFRTQPQDYADQPWFVNQVAKLELEKKWTPLEFLRKILELESSLGRVRGNGPRFGPRKIDLDLLLFGNCESDQPECILPHPRMTRRAFVLVPLLAIEPELEIAGKKIPQWLRMLPWRLEADRIYQ